MLVKPGDKVSGLAKARSMTGNGGKCAVAMPQCIVCGAGFPATQCIKHPQEPKRLCESCALDSAARWRATAARTAETALAAARSESGERVKESVR
eukprot:SAG11_NODE_3098_length_2695_cov_1.971121_3_plen_95_part_00